MFFNVKYLTLASLIVVVVSQTPPPCVLSCSQAALPYATNTSCTSYADTCVCTDKGFQAADGACLQANCTAADQAAANQLNQAFCGGSSNTTGTASGTASMATTMSGSMSANMTSMTGTASSGGSATGSSSGSAASASKSSGAGPQAEFGIFTLGVAAAGAVVGGLLI